MSRIAYFSLLSPPRISASPRISAFPPGFGCALNGTLTEFVSISQPHPAVLPQPPSAHLRTEADEVISALRCAIMPGLVNAHTHLSQTFMRGVARLGLVENLRGDECRQAVIHLRQRAGIN